MGQIQKKIQNFYFKGIIHGRSIFDLNKIPQGKDQLGGYVNEDPIHFYAEFDSL